MAVLSYVTAKIGGTTSTFTPADVAGDSIAQNSRGALLVKNDSVGAITVTLLVPGKTEFGPDQPDVAVSVPAGAQRLIGPMVRGLANPDTNSVEITYSAVASVTVAAIHI